MSYPITKRNYHNKQLETARKIRREMIMKTAWDYFVGSLIIVGIFLVAVVIMTF